MPKRFLPDDGAQSKRLRVEEDAALGRFSRLTTELTLKIFSCLSATDLATLSCVSGACRELASTNALWHRLYDARWKESGATEESGTWKSRYFQKERQETDAVLQTVASEFSDMFREMQKARRSMSFGPCSYEIIAQRPTAAAKERLPVKALQWLREHGFEEEAVQECSAETKGSRFVEIEGVFICEQTGAVHFCDDKCQELLLASGHDVCPISGRTLPPLLISHDIHSGAESDEEDQDFCGRLGRAFAAGYGCSDETELHRMWQ